MKYRLKRSVETIGDLSITVECLENLDQTIDDLFVELEREGNPALLEELCPYFGTVWPSARALAEAITERKSLFAGKRILELGCGLAIPSLVAARLGAQVTATDFHPEVPGFMETNLKLNEIDSIRYLPVDWSKGFPDLERFDWVIGSDILYEKQHALFLPQVLERSMKPDGHAWIADPARPYLQAFVDEMTRAGFKHRTQVRLASEASKPKEVFLVEFAKSFNQ